MATFFLDFENGNDANDGTTFANRWKTITNGATAARTAPGDTIRIMGSPAPTSLGQNGVWTSQALQLTKNIAAATNATPIVITCTTHGYSTGDTVVVSAAAGNTNANGTWEITVSDANTFSLNGSAGNATYTGSGLVRLRNNTRVMLTSAVTQNIASTGPGRSAWTSADGTNVVTSLSTTTKEHQQSDQIAIQAGFTTGLAAYYPTGTLDLSGYQQVSFWIQLLSGTVGAAGAVDLRLCSDTAGVTAVNTISIPNLATTGRWMPVTVDLGTNLGSSIRSIAFYVNTDDGAQTFLLSNIIACKASSASDSLTLTSLIGKNSAGETFWGIQSISGTRVMLDADTNALPTSTIVRGYYGTSETVTTWKRETIKLGPAATATTAVQTIQESGADGSPIAYSGGWDRTAMSTQSLETWLDGVNGNGYGIVSTVRSFISFANVAVTRFNRGYSCSSTSTALKNSYSIVAANNNAIGAFITDLGCTIEINNACANSSRGLDCIASRGEHLITFAKLISNGSDGFNGFGFPRSLATFAAKNNGSYGIILIYGLGSLCLNCDLEANGAGGLQLFGTAYFKDCLVNDAFEVSNAFEGSVLFSHNHDQVANNHRIFLDSALIRSATDQRHTASGISWKIQPTSTRRSSAWPIILSLAKVACSANNLVTIKAWMYRDNSGLTMRLVCKGGQIAGVSSDVTASVTTTNAWEEETITFTPTETGVVEITAEAWGGSTFSGWVDDMTISQA
jgi:hypothetical protein